MGKPLHCILTTDYRLQNADYRLQTTDYRLQTTDYRLQTTDYRLQTTDYGPEMQKDNFFTQARFEPK